MVSSKQTQRLGVKLSADYCSAANSISYDGNKLKFLKSGYLPFGVHEISTETLAPLVRFNGPRRAMWAKLCSFLLWPAQSSDFPWVYIGGGFLSTKPYPLDIDLVLQTGQAYGPRAFKAMSPFFAAGLMHIHKVYGIHLHFWMENAPEGFCDFRVFFQYNRSSVPTAKLDPARGVVRLSLRDRGNIVAFQTGLSR